MGFRASEGKSLSPKCVEAIQNIPKPETKKQVMSFLGITSYCRQWIPNYAEIEAPLAAVACERPSSRRQSDLD